MPWQNTHLHCVQPLQPALSTGSLQGLRLNKTLMDRPEDFLARHAWGRPPPAALTPLWHGRAGEPHGLGQASSHTFASRLDSSFQYISSTPADRPPSVEPAVSVEVQSGNPPTLLPPGQAFSEADLQAVIDASNVEAAKEHRIAVMGQEALRAQGLRKVAVAQDGNCLFRAVAIMLQRQCGTLVSHGALRQGVIETLRLSEGWARSGNARNATFTSHLSISLVWHVKILGLTTVPLLPLHIILM